MTVLKSLTIVGVGLLGGSAGLAAIRRGVAKRVVGVVRRPESIEAAQRIAAVTSATLDLAEGVAEADLVVICSPVGLIAEHARAVAEHCPVGTLITDVGSTKLSIVEELDDSLPRGCRFLGGHPLAGSETSGVAAADERLFEGKLAILTPTENTRPEDYATLERFWTALGSTVVRMSAAEHDAVVAVTSHLPHAVAAALAGSLPAEYSSLTGTGFRDTARLASGEPRLWKQIFSLNRDNVLAALDRFKHRLAALEAAIRDQDEAALEDLLTTAKKNRDALGS